MADHGAEAPPAREVEAEEGEEEEAAVEEGGGLLQPAAAAGAAGAPPPVYRCRIHLRVGAPGTRLRERQGLMLVDPIPFCPATTNLTTFRGANVDRLLRLGQPYLWNRDQRIYLKRTRQQPCSSFEELTQEEMEEALARCYKLLNVVQLYIYLGDARPPRSGHIRNVWETPVKNIPLPLNPKAARAETRSPRVNGTRTIALSPTGE
jgi:hypothetical protein